MERSERWILGIAILLTIGVACLAVSRNVAMQRTVQAQKEAQKPVVLTLSSQELFAGNTDYLGERNSPYTLVEFADYQCPPCRAASQELPELLTRYRGKLRFSFRNYPLTNLHLLAMSAAIAAEAAREQHQFWPMHDALMQGDLDASAITGLVSRLHLDRSRYDQACQTSAKKRVEDDMKLADRFNLSSTPTFVLCCPDGRTIRLGLLTQIADYLH
ncbi:MAG TPA: thioredoxin domain-containing protein [Chthonomonadaceae bacterium]|nr:thioredoxin domain-containing protein [Chthonomonadaceae bacterium]